MSRDALDPRAPGGGAHGAARAAALIPAPAGNPIVRHPRESGGPVRLLRVAAWAALLCGTLLTTLLVLGTCRPSNYGPRAIDYERLDDDKRALFGTLDQISAALNAGRSIRISLDEAQVNRWLAARGEIWPDDPALFPPGVQRPQLTIRPQGISGAVQVESGEWSAVLSVAVAVELDEQGVLLELSALRVGRLPIPLGVLRLAVGARARQHPGLTELLDEGRGRVPNQFTWKNGRRTFLLENLVLERGRLNVTLTPRP